jgi:hypothetical protein
MRLVVLLFIFTTYFSFSLDKTSFKLNVSYDGVSTFLEAGYSDSTTNVYDENYENDLPPFPPPQGIIPTFRIIREYEGREDELIFTDIDLRAKPIQNDTIIDYAFELLGNREQGKDFRLTVPIGDLDQRIKEIRVVDNITGGTLVDSNIVNGVPLVIDNIFIETYTISVRFIQTETSVSNTAEDNGFYYSNGIIYNEGNNADRVAVYGLNGTKQIEVKGSNSSFNVNSLGRGVYFAYIYYNDNVVGKLKIVKL